MLGVQSDFASPFALDKYSSTLRSLLMPDLVAKLNQTVIDVQRTDSMMAE